jgi:hypothetical protein
MADKKIGELSLAEALVKRKILVKDLLTFRLSLDPNGVQTEGGVPGLQRTLRLLDLRIATLKTNEK